MSLTRLLEQSSWANREWVEFVYGGDAVEERPRKILSHIMLSERVWFDRIEGRPESTTDPLLTRDELVQGFTDNVAVYRRFLGGDLTRVIQFRRASGEEYHARIDDILYHLFTHGYHHRGQLAAHYARKGVPYPNTDHINYLLVNKV